MVSRRSYTQEVGALLAQRLDPGVRTSLGHRLLKPACLKLRRPRSFPPAPRRFRPEGWTRTHQLPRLDTRAKMAPGVPRAGVVARLCFLVACLLLHVTEGTCPLPASDHPWPPFPSRQGTLAAPSPTPQSLCSPAVRKRRARLPTPHVPRTSSPHAARSSPAKHRAACDRGFGERPSAPRERGLGVGPLMFGQGASQDLRWTGGHE